MTITLHSVAGSHTGFRQRITLPSGEVTLDADLDGTGFSPHDLFDIAIASCKAMAITMHAERKGFPLKGVGVEVSRDTSRERDGRYGLDVAITLEGSLTESQRQRLIEVAEHCAVQRLATKSTVTVKSHLTEKKTAELANGVP